VDYATSSPGSLFNLMVAEVQNKNGVRQVARSEVHRNLSMNSFASNYAVDVVKAGSNLIRLERPAGLAMPATNGRAESAPITATRVAQLGPNAGRVAVSLNGGKTYEIDCLPATPLTGTATSLKADLDAIAQKIQDEVQLLEPATNLSFHNFGCTAGADGPAIMLTATSGTGGEESSVSITSASQRNAAAILGFGTANGGREVAAAADIRPVASGTAWPRQPQPFVFASLPATASIDVDIVDPAGTVILHKVITLWTAATKPVDLEGVRRAIETAMNADSAPEFKTATAQIADDQILVRPGGGDPSVYFHFNSGPVTTGTGTTDLAKSGVENIAAYQLGVGLNVLAQANANVGFDGNVPTSTSIFSGSLAAKTGIYALEDADLFNILMIPNQFDASLQAEAVAYAKSRRAFALLDLPPTTDTLSEAKTWIAAAGTPHDANAAAYFPRILMADPLRDNRIYSFANCGAVAGLYARTDSERGVWKAPAGTAATLTGVQGLDYNLTDAENGVLNPLGLNAIRTFPVYGNIVWGARTLLGADAQASEWKYVPVRRLTLFLEESLCRGTQWVVFEPNDEPLWAQIRLNIGAFLNGLFRQGAFQGKTPKEAYFVKCDRETTTQADINNGIVNIMVGFAPLKPAEFVVIKIQQMAGDIPT
jgi:phage tail sheath protein FI